MSELINNREHAAGQMDEQQLRRREELKAIIKQLHEGVDPAQVKERFRAAVGSVEVEEISLLEESLMREEGIPVSEVQRLCSVHASIFDGAISDIHGSSSSAPESQPGHPVHTFKLENRELERLTGFSISLHLDKFMKDDSDANRYKLLEDLNLLLDADKHYSRKENLLFPYLERYGIYGPTQVMWGVDDGIRAEIKAAKELLADYKGDREAVKTRIEVAVREVEEMIFKEENILLPMALKKLTEDEWVKIAEETEEIGYCLIPGTARWVPTRAAEPGAMSEAEQPAPISRGLEGHLEASHAHGEDAAAMPPFLAGGEKPEGMPQWVADMLRQQQQEEQAASTPVPTASPAQDQAVSIAEQAAKMAVQAAEMARQAAEMAASVNGSMKTVQHAQPQRPVGVGTASASPESAASAAPISDGYVRFNTGILSVQQLELIMNHLPVDLTYIDENDIVRYFSHGKERIFARTKAVIGRSVQNCHPPQSVHVVEDLLRDFRSGRKDHEDFWIPFKDKFVYIRYFAIRDEQGTYLGTLEFTQNVAPIRELEGQKRILSEA
ncbi:DUF438 domain-containing protein [Saccharibacillus endophyticus]|uniref:DUF438 domain-containing protein n=1 Tax=Saccharibacillus endophyticus TaxID=2060666 RepID=A0ABQ2A0Y8_9BACL|nr:DUF438 domain-containing protein [Saccharibacillus endophyticus]GGH83603.1 hypothetical protein GCM10007362_36710 [Saccharibacillus endophyticus]